MRSSRLNIFSSTEHWKREEPDFQIERKVVESRTKGEESKRKRKWMESGGKKKELRKGNGEEKIRRRV